MRSRLILLAAISAAASATSCSASDDGSNWNYGSPDGSTADGSTEDATDAGDSATIPDGESPDVALPEAGDANPDVNPPPTCPPDVTCVSTFPFGDDRDTADEPQGVLDGYGCSPESDESGPEVVYLVTVPERGFLSAAVIEADGVDVDVHILSAFDPAACLDRGNYDARADVEPGDYYVVVDTYASGGTPQSGVFHVDIGFVVPSRGSCGMEVGEMARVGDNGVSLPMPATGPMVLEAHLVTQEEPPPYPSTATEYLNAHYDLSQARTGFVMHRSQNWAPLEGGSFYGAGIGSPGDFPVVDEGWYVNMYWTSAARPAKGTRMLVQLPGTNRAVVVAAGYETGPGNLDNIGGTVEETHFYLDTTHQSELTLGIAVDQSLPLGPRECE